MLDSGVLNERLYRSMYRIRYVEEEIARVYPTDSIKSPVHLSIGQEAISVGVCDALSREDVVFGTYRGHAMYLAKGGDLNRMIAELYGKETGCTRGKGGSMHLIDVDAGVMGTSAVVATTIPEAVGYAYATKVQRRGAVVAAFFGEGAAEEGAFHESMNFAALKRVPAIFICENNGLAIHSRQTARQRLSNICERAQSYGMPAERIEDGDVLRIRDRIAEVASAIRHEEAGPHFFECDTFRWREHVGPNEDFTAGYRSRAEAEPWILNDQVARIGRLLDPEIRESIAASVVDEVARAFAFAEDSPYPADSELYSNVYSGS